MRDIDIRKVTVGLMPYSPLTGASVRSYKLLVGLVTASFSLKSLIYFYLLPIQIFIRAIVITFAILCCACSHELYVYINAYIYSYIYIYLCTNVYISIYIYIYIYIHTHTYIRTCRGVRILRMGNIARRVGIEPIPLAFWTSMLTITPHRLPNVITLPTPACICDSLPERQVQTTTMQMKKHNQY